MSTFEGQMAGWLYPHTLNNPEARRAGAAGKIPGHVSENVSGHVSRNTEADADQAIAALVAEYSQPLYRVAFSVVRNAAEAEDAVQETFLRVLKNKQKLAEVRDTRVWLVRITWNVVLDRKRRAKVRPETDDIAEMGRTLCCSGLGSEALTIGSAEYRRILALIDRLPAKERETLLLSAVEELSTVEIAAVVGATESSVRSRLFRARQMLARLLRSEPQNPGRRPTEIAPTGIDRPHLSRRGGAR